MISVWITVALSVGIIGYMLGTLRQFLSERFGEIRETLKLIQMNEAQTAQALKDLSAKADKIAIEQQKRADALQEAIDKLTAQINNGGEVSTELAAALTELQGKMTALDDSIPDAAPPA